MTVVPIPSDFRELFWGQPETGMGFQEISIPEGLRRYGDRVFVINSSYLVIVDSEQFSRQGFRPFVPLYRDLETLLARAGEREHNFREWVQESLRVYAWQPELPDSPPDPSSPNLPPFLQFSRSGDEFFRLSAQHSDWRINPDGSVAPDTYATTSNDLTVTSSGLAAVGRYALPSSLPACYVYQIIPPPGTAMFFGTVTPNFGMAGGGVEVFFPYGVAPGSARLWKTLPIY